MLKKFYVDHFRNLTLTEPIIFGQNTGFYGGCASGKSSLCRAIGDIAAVQEPEGNVDDREANFSYDFQFCCCEVLFCYTRNRKGMICRGELSCGGQSWAAGPKEQWSRAGEFLEYVLETIHDRRGTMIRNAAALLLEMLAGTCVCIDESFRAGKTQNKHTGMSDISCKKDYRMLHPQTKLVLCDDIESHGEIREWVSSHDIQAVFFSVRPQVLLEQCKATGRFYIIKNSTVMDLRKVAEKDLRTGNQIVEYLKNS